ncbi:YIP1 family protein [Maritalea mobilis]|uniref:hypothetical protein n=1 Tax=Maritalea mobilis TaxID=483324 RepID=UPI001C98762C|nr:hypothetical protein [Maritalea mobilis]MBY6200386.1 YIP1 family protein [Maritalea mobilis]
MSLTGDIAATWRSPRRVMRKLLDMGQREDRALFFLMLACGLIFVSQWPLLSRQAYLDPSVPLDARIGGALFAWILWMPIFAYILAAISHLLAMPFGGKGSWYSARLALFWSMLCATPAWLLYGLVSGFIGPGPAQTATGAILAVVFLGFWTIALREAETYTGVEQPQ